MTTINDLIDLLTKHLQGNLTAPEQAQLDHWLSQSERNRRLFDSINDEEQLRQWIMAYHQEAEEDNEAIILAKIKQQLNSSRPVTPVRRINTWQRWASVAAITLLVAGIGGYFWGNRKAATPPVVQHTAPADIQPGRDGAILTLADGRKVVLDSLGNGVIANQNGTQVSLQNGALSYTTGTAAAATEYNNLTTPRGRQFQLILPDGTHVWLNAASSLRYPIAFTGKERRVEVSGEIYFEVAHDKTKPFIVNIGENRIEVLGTRFNVNAYSNEAAIRTTLLEGKVKVSSMVNGQWSILKPGEQAKKAGNSPLTIDHSPDLEQVMAWKNGFFNFEDASLEEVMRQLERWYDIDVVYEKGIPDITFGGKMSNDVSLSGLLRSLQQMDVHFRMEGRKLIVLP